jgi:DNA-binding NarL/FixJ family response regulator
MRRKHQILIVDDDGLLRDGLCALLNAEDDFAVIAAIGGGPEIISVHPQSNPEVILMDFEPAGLRGADAVAALRHRWPQVPVLVLTFHREDQVLEAALRAGVDGYLLKTDARSELITALRAVIQRKRYISPSIFERVVSGYVRKSTHAQQHEADGLSDRERAVMRAIAQGYRTREIAEQLSLSHKTIEKYRSTLMRKLGLRTATAVAAYAISNGYLE